MGLPSRVVVMTPLSMIPVVSRQSAGVGVAFCAVGVGETGEYVGVGFITGMVEAGMGVFGGETGCGEEHPGRSRPRSRKNPISWRKQWDLEKLCILSI
jgi:hypothetical protein